MERAFSFLSFFLWSSCVCFVYLRSQRILKVTPLVWGRNPQEQVIANTVAIFTFSVQFNSGRDQSEKPKTSKFISKSLITPSVLLYNHLKQVRPSLAINLHIHNLMVIINETYSNYKFISEKSIFKNWEQVWNFRIQISLCFFLIGSYLTSSKAIKDFFRQFSDWFTLNNSDWFILTDSNWCLWIHI